ncbi:MAG: hypothetical protein JXR63_07290 [Spirochaetales bacterium]|nr:hypothetical protein [Spirochaetales bacterium]
MLVSKVRFLTILYTLFIVVSLFAEDDLDDFFADDDGEFEIVEVDDADEKKEDTLLVTGLTWGGLFWSQLDFRWSWDDYLTRPAKAYSATSFVPEIDSYIWFDSRPKDNFRVFGKFSLSGGTGLALDNFNFSMDNWQVIDNGDGSFSVGPGLGESSEDDIQQDFLAGMSSSSNITFSVREFFVDFDYEKKLFFRFGKSFLKWGVGYLFSPADIVNLSPINLERPDQEREGPLSLRLQYPFGPHNFYAYLLTDSVTKPEQLALGSRLEFLVENSELGLGFYYKKNSAPRFMATFSAPVGDIKFFGEMMLSWGSDRVFVRPSRIQPEFEEDEQDYFALDTFTIDDKPFFSGTLGFLFFKQDPSITVVFQYYFNGDGYSSYRVDGNRSLLDAAYYLLQNPETNGLALPPESQGDRYQSPDTLGINDLFFFGQHYFGLIFAWGSIGDSNFGFSSYWIANMSDNSGLVSLELNYEFMEELVLVGGTRMTYGASGTEFMDTAGLILQNSTIDSQQPIFELYLRLRVGLGGF